MLCARLNFLPPQLKTSSYAHALSPTHKHKHKHKDKHAHVRAHTHCNGPKFMARLLGPGVIGNMLRVKFPPPEVAVQGYFLPPEVMPVPASRKLVTL